jgi:AraC-like DNA-binding protein
MSTPLPPISTDLISELLLGMRLSGVQFRRIAIAPDTGVGFSNTAGRGQFHFVGRGPVWLRSASGAVHALASGDAMLIPHGGAHAMLAAPDTATASVAALDLAAPPSTGEAGRPVIFSYCMEFDLGGMQPLVAAMPEVMLAGTLLAIAPEITPMLSAMEREAMSAQAGQAGILARLAEVLASMTVRAWVTGGCINENGPAAGLVRALHDPRLSRAIVGMHMEPGRNWTVETLASEAGISRSVFAQRFLKATGVAPLRYLTILRMRLAVHSLGFERQAVNVVATQLGYGSLAAFSRAFKRTVGTAPGAVRAGST